MTVMGKELGGGRKMVEAQNKRDNPNSSCRLWREWA